MTWKEVWKQTAIQIMHTVLVFALGVTTPVVCVFGGIKFVDWVFNHNTSISHMWLGVVFGLAVYSFFFLIYRRWVKQLDKELP